MAEKIEIEIRKIKNFAENESYKKLRTNIQFCGKNIRAVAVTSTLPNDGKSEVSLKLAWSLAEMGKKTLYLDADLRNSTFLTRYNIRKELKGLAHFLVGENTVDEIITGTQNPSLDIIPIGAFPPNPSELLSQNGYKELIDELKNRYDYVIIDTPPAGIVIDGVIASEAADGVVLVISSGRISTKSAQMALTELSKANCKVIGCVLNKCRLKEGGYGGYGYGGYGYGSYGYGEYGYGNSHAHKSKRGIGRIFGKKGKAEKASKSS